MLGIQDCGPHYSGTGRNFPPDFRRAVRIIVVDAHISPNPAANRPISPQNPLLKQVRRAAQKGALTDDGFALAEGVHLLQDAVAAGLEMRAILVADGAFPQHRELLDSLPHLANAKIRSVDDKTFRELVTTESPQGILTLVRPKAFEMADLLTSSANAAAMVVILDGVQDPGNAGAIARAAEAFGATGLLFLKGTVNPFNPKCMRGSAGSLLRIPLLTGVDPASGFLPHGLPVFAADPHRGAFAHEADLRQPCAIIIGSEGHGVRPELLARATPLRIPTVGVESLNAAVAAGILFYEARRQRSSEQGSTPSPRPGRTL
jgi:TrmH family RNA methyltransferase